MPSYSFCRADNKNEREGENERGAGARSALGCGVDEGKEEKVRWPGGGERSLPRAREEERKPRVDSDCKRRPAPAHPEKKERDIPAAAG